ncbi:MAG: hypothetical protein JWM21_26 [Acidobacteria bacterium]|nr:hypothetical protein [Acidobacteriota bacterium]
MTTLYKARGYNFTRPTVKPAATSTTELHGNFKMNGLRMYLRSVGPEPRTGPAVFYSRRGDGPYYQWRYEEKAGQWRGSRVNVSEFAPRELLMANWKNVPSALQAKLGEHYLD